VINSFEQEIGSKGYTDKTHIDLTEDSDSITGSSAAATNKSSLPGLAERNMHAVGTSTDLGRRVLPRNQDVVMRGGPGSEREGNTYLRTMIQVNVGQQRDSFEMKRIKCRAILERMKRRGSRFFLKLKETDSDDEMYVLSDTEAQDVIYTAFCAEEKKMQSPFVETPNAASMLDGNGRHPGLSGVLGAGQFASMSGLQGDAAMLSQLKANNEMNLLASQQASLKRPLPGHGHHIHHSHENIIEKRLKAETDEHIKILIERERQRRNDPYSAAGLAGRLPFNNAAMESSMPMSAAFAGATSNGIDQYLKERLADEMLLKSAAGARTTFSAGPSPSGLAGELPKSNNHFVEFLKKKYVKSAQKRAW
jgi:hypothetical protein